MIEIIMQAIIDSSDISFYSQADHILDMIENEGMQPPLNLRKSNMARQDVFEWDSEFSNEEEE